MYLATCVACKISRGMISFRALEGMDNEALTCGRSKPPIYVAQNVISFQLPRLAGNRFRNRRTVSNFIFSVL